jgi:hypothetical protein
LLQRSAVSTFSGLLNSSPRFPGEECFVHPALLFAR